MSAGPPGVRGIGVDIADVERMGAALTRTPSLLGRLFTAEERCARDGTPRPARSLAARFAAKEAVSKVLESAEPGWRWTDIQVGTTPSGRPTVSVTGPLADRARALGVAAWHVSLSHDRGAALAVVVAVG